MGALRRVAHGAALSAALAGACAGDAQGTLELALPVMEPGGARAVGLGGALAGLADDADAALVNPAGLGMLPRALDAVLSGGRVWGGLSEFTFGLSPWRRFALGLTPYAVRLDRDLDLAAAPGMSRPVRVRVAEIAPLALAWRPHASLALGAAVRPTRISLRPRSGGGDGPGATGVTWNAGVVFRPHPDARVGFAYQRDRVFALPAETDGTRLRLRTPEVISAGLAWAMPFETARGQRRLLFSSQADVVRRRRPEGGTYPGHAAEWRAGVEYTHPFHCYSGCGTVLQLRAGARSAAPLPDLSPAGPPRPQGGAQALHWSLGGSLALQSVLRGRLRFDAALRLSPDMRATFLAGVALRYPESYRGSLSSGRAGEAAP